jgi:hypothetical protein
MRPRCTPLLLIALFQEIFMQFRLITSALTLGLLTACGGGGGGGGSDNKPANTVSSVSSSSSAPAANIDYTAVAGLYDASRTSNNIKDENYLYIGTDGKITAYNYMGDSKDLGDNCYKVASETETNGTLNGKTLSYSAANSTFTADTGKSEVHWVVSGDTVTTIKLGTFLSGKSITISSGGESFVVDSVKITTPTITDITGALCQ